MATKKKRERGRPMQLRYPPRIDASPEDIARVVLRADLSVVDGATPEYRCQACGEAVHYPDTLYEDGRCADCHA